MAASLPIPLFTSLQEVYPERAIETQRLRWNNLFGMFEGHFGKRPEYIARAPGRVNLIVLPAAIERDILIAVAHREEHDPGRVTAENLDNKYSRETFAPTRDAQDAWLLDIDKEQLRWESYVKSGYMGVLEKFFAERQDLPKGIDLLVTGSVPPGSGLSSSAAMVVASTLSFLVLNEKVDGISKGDLVRITMENERRVGVNSGGMDQSASVMSTAGSALYVDFFPVLSASPIQLPVTSPHCVFVCANSLVVSDKVVHARTRYNLRVVETLVAARILARQLGVEVQPKEKVTLREVLERWMGLPKDQEVSISQLKGGLERILEHLEGLKSANATADGETGLPLEEMVELSGLTKDEFHEICLSWVDVDAAHFQLYKRAQHVFSEAWRVLEFHDLCLQDSQSDGSSHETLLEVGRLMDESQKSCSELYECSCPELDELTRLAKEAGAYGSRLTGAGWGGCTVSLVEEARVSEFIAKIQATYPPYHGLHDEALQEVIFATKPSSGACIFQVGSAPL